MTARPPSRAPGYAPLSGDALERWGRFGSWDREYFPTLLGFVVEEVRHDYCRMRLPFRDAIEQPAGVVHGGAIAALIDSVVVPAIGSAYHGDEGFATIDLQVQYLNALVQEDAVAEGWVVQRGRSIVFCEAEVAGDRSGRIVARGLLTYKVSRPRH
jgi:uncharacterized protein (TIGR00369 family)